MPGDFFWLDRPIGRVDSQYRLTRTEITNTQWIEFVDAYAHANPGANLNDLSFIGRDVYYTSTDPANFGWYTAPGAENAAAQMGWLYAARYCNWLENGKSSDPRAFESGVYDISSFHRLPDNTWVGNSEHAPGARFWLPDWNEHVKGLYWDPNKLGPGQGWYWLYPHSSDSPPVGGLPGTPGASPAPATTPTRRSTCPWGRTRTRNRPGACSTARAARRSTSGSGSTVPCLCAAPERVGVPLRSTVWIM